MELGRAYQKPSAVNVVLLHGLLTVPVVQLHRETHGAVSVMGCCVPPSSPPPELSNLRYLWLASPFLILCLAEGPGPHLSHTFTTPLAMSKMEKLYTLVLGTRTSGNTLSSKSKKGGHIVVRKVEKK